MQAIYTDVAVIGAGHAGLGVSSCLKRDKIDHLVFERGLIGETWISQRWDTFVMNTPNKYNVLPGNPDPGNRIEGFGTAREYVSYLKTHCEKFRLPVKENSIVTSIEKSNGDSYFLISVLENGIQKHYRSNQVVVATGCMNEKRIPAFASKISASIVQLHTCGYRSAASLTEGNVLVVGSAQSGCQIAEDLVDAGRKVFLSTSMVGRFPRRYRGKDIVDWLVKMEFFDLKTEDVKDPSLFTMKVPVVSGIGPLGHTISYQSLAKKGVIILGKAQDADENNVYLAPNAAQHVKYGDEYSQKVKGMVEEFLAQNRIDAPAPEDDPDDVPDPEANCISPITILNLEKMNIKSIIWSTGFNGDFSYLKMDVLGVDGLPKHRQGISDIKGLYFVGLPWLRMRKSANLIGINDDVVFISGAVAGNVKVHG